VLDEGERRRRHGGERNERCTAPCADTAHACLRPPRGRQFVGRPEAFERDLHRLARVVPGGDVASDRVVEVVPELGTQAA
jgi:methyl coenzyme M reductase alpha subunit